METINILDNKSFLGDTIRRAQRAPVRITERGEAVAVIMSMEDYEAAEELKRRFLREAVASGLDDLDNGRIVDADSFFDDLEAGKFD